ncbi:MAG TPA: shikimate dehydrogenase [Candidatus Accumulibacter phosphatis]|nr:MAG: Shikimate dehydrogenase [Candidatus Accumulibacter sp. SK-11]HAY27056.1 shikimate dehydrogenase [Accumulibacter sp.]HRL75843.1 shikimate dehydrogenase [Candidatus Accumulibacter phosphatis]HCN69190.1 shikimate dehydrogenase [Accumulibacter sp.]HCV12487.1 shikimate dehydrogenase [Accumulibacter sp.]
MSERYGVFGNPVNHSKSPAIHAAFAAACNQDLAYEAILAPRDGFADCVRVFVAAGGCGANVTVPFKQEACRLATRLTPRARLAGAVNTLSFDSTGWLGDNTDGAGLLRDLTNNLGCTISGTRVLLLGAGGAARGVLGPLLEAAPSRLVIANRTPASAHELAERMTGAGKLGACSYPQLAGESFDLVINATSASLAGEPLALPDGIFAPGSLAYDMMYGQGQTPFLLLAASHGATRLADGLGMLVEQAAEAFHLWRGIRPATAPVMAMLRADRNECGSR